MLKSNVTWPTHRQYKSETDWEPIGFFSECLCNSTRFDLLLGFFSSSAIQVLSNSFAVFIHNGGTMRLIINNILSEEDKSAITIGTSDDDITPFDLSDLASLSDTLSKRDKHFFECLAWLIANKRIEIRIIAPKSNIGISHTKQGVFTDGKNTVSFNGSCNFSKTALIHNIESIDASCEWDDNISKSKVENTIFNFNQTFAERDTSVRYLDSKQLEINILTEFGDKSLHDLLIQEKELTQQDTTKHSLRATVSKVIKQSSDRLDEILKAKQDELEKPKFPYAEGPREYQKKAFDRWRNNQQQGIFAMATGTGKTITSLNCLLEIYNRCGYYKALILVPTITLVNQWEEECRKFNFNRIIKVYSKSSWSDELGLIITTEKISPEKKDSYIVISTYASYIRKNIFSELNQLSVNTLLIADEAHNMGAGSLLTLLPKVKQLRRIGLSATPERQYDDEGNDKIRKFFNTPMDYTFEYSMKEAIDKEVLCRYYYFPHIVKLTDSEMEEYQKISEQIVYYYNAKSEKFNSNDILTKLLLKRKRIIHKAKNKKDVFLKILQKYYQEKKSLKYTLIYVPEGNEPDEYGETDSYTYNDAIPDDEESLHLIDVYTQIVKDISDEVTVKMFTSSSTNRDELLDMFAIGNLHVLTSMKCLDEGVDVPRAELAVFCASTGNPRQFIQRRGRILRKHKDKEYAYIHDLVVVPEVSIGNNCFNMERNLLKEELKRVNNFAESSENSSHTIDILQNIMNYYKLNLYNNE